MLQHQSDAPAHGLTHSLLPADCGQEHPGPGSHAGHAAARGRHPDALQPPQRAQRHASRMTQPPAAPATAQQKWLLPLMPVSLMTSRVGSPLPVAPAAAQKKRRFASLVMRSRSDGSLTSKRAAAAQTPLM